MIRRFLQPESEMEISALLPTEPLSLTSSSKGKGKGIEVVGITTVTEELGALNPSSDIEEDYSTLEHVPGIDLGLLADEDLSGHWWKRFDPPEELIWTDEDRCRFGETSPFDCLEKLENVLQELQKEVSAEGATNRLVTVAVRSEPEQSRPDYGDQAPEVFLDAIEVIPPLESEGSHPLTLSVSSGPLGVAELESPTTPSSATSTSGSSFPSSLTGSKRQSTPKREFTMTNSLVYSPYFASLPSSDRTVASMPTSPRVQQIRRFWSKRIGESECSSCMDGHKNRKLTTLECQHKYCHACLETLIKTAMQDESLWAPHCCIRDIPKKTIKSTLSRKDYHAFSDKAKEYGTPAADRIYCPQPACSAWIPPSAEKDIVCPRCKAEVCRTCRGAAHPAQEDCPEDFELQATLQEGERQGWRRCFQCRTMVERTMGCNHMTCNCNAEFCYVCGGVWKTCACRPDEEQQRRQARNDQEAAEQAAREREQAEIQAAIAAAEAMIRREEEERIKKANAAKIAARRRARKEAAKKEQLAEQERAMQEEWMKIVKANCDRLRGELENLYRKQRKSLNERHRRERIEMENEFILCEMEVQEKFTADMKVLVSGQEKELDEQITLHQREREKLSNEQATEEDEYWFSLQSYLKARPNREERRKTLMERFNACQAQQMNVLHQYQEDKLAEVKTRHEEQLENLKSGMANAQEVNTRAKTTKMKDMTRRQFADTKWFETIRVARHDKLAELGEAANSDEKRNILLGWRQEPVELQS